MKKFDAIIWCMLLAIFGSGWPITTTRTTTGALAAVIGAAPPPYMKSAPSDAAIDEYHQHNNNNNHHHHQQQQQQQRERQQEHEREQQLQQELSKFYGNGGLPELALPDELRTALAWNAADPPAGMRDGQYGELAARHSLDRGLASPAEERRAVYDPGDDLLRALTADFAAGSAMAARDDYEADAFANDLEGADKYEILLKLQKELQEDQEIVSKSALLMKLLEDPTIQTLPVVYVEEETEVVPISAGDVEGVAPDSDDDGDDDADGPYASGRGITKRGRYYRRYTWKRHNRNRSSNYEPELRYACTPSKKDVFHLLMNLHENRKGNHGRTVNFCNRKRPAKAIFTNIRFLG